VEAFVEVLMVPRRADHRKRELELPKEKSISRAVVNWCKEQSCNSMAILMMMPYYRI
jgi:hypothetical protein